ncbi:hypothetical protein CSA08_03550 [Candidatus Gracilibacteria bacterium]|nr:MAG: hypothetical protein CSA08_03550 [Candidatus Gracilibacteria bacterium]
MKYKEGVLDRFSQSIELYGKNFIKLTLPFIIYNAIMLLAVMGAIITILATLTGGNEPTTAMAILVILAIIVVLLVYLVFSVPVFACTFRSIKNAANGETIDLKANFSYGMKNFGGVIKMYWFVFMYVVLVPFIITLIGFIMIIAGIEAGSFVVVIGGVMQLIFLFYRGLKTSFSVVDSIDTDNYTKENFDKKLSLTNGKLWRVIGNYFVYGILVGIIMWVVGMITGSIGTNPSIVDIDFKDLRSFIVYTQSYNFFAGLVGDIIELVISSILTVFGMAFVYIFYKRLESEQK